MKRWHLYSTIGILTVASCLLFGQDRPSPSPSALDRLAVRGEYELEDHYEADTGLPLTDVDRDGCTTVDDMLLVIQWMGDCKDE